MDNPNDDSPLDLSQPATPEMIEVAFAYGLAAVPLDQRAEFFEGFARRLVGAEPLEASKDDDLGLTPEEYDRLIVQPVARLTRLIESDEWSPNWLERPDLGVIQP